MKINLHLDPPWISVYFGKRYINFGFYNNLETYLDETGEKPQLKTRRNGYRWFFVNRENKPYEFGSYERMIKEWNAGK